MTDFEPDYEVNDVPCPKCGKTQTHSRECSSFSCADGFLDLYEEDPIIYQPGEIDICGECRGRGSVSWCPNCGHDLNVKTEEASRPP